MLHFGLRVLEERVVAGFGLARLGRVTSWPSAANLPAMDAAGLPALQDAIRHLHGLEATWLESVPVHEKHEGATVWEGEVQVFAVEHPKATRVYAWSHESEGGKRRFHAVLGGEPVTDASLAVRLCIRSEAEAKRHVSS